MTGRDYRWWTATTFCIVTSLPGVGPHDGHFGGAGGGAHPWAGRSRRADLVGLAWVVLALGAYLSPAVKDGFSFGPSGLGGQLSYFTYIPNLVLGNHLNGDIITQAVAWNQLDWLAVHHGQLPLWDNFSGDGMPLMLNFESAPFSLPALVGYLFPLSSSFLVVVAVKLLIAGTGAYVACRLAGARPLGAALAGTTFMLSGSLSGWAGWAVSGPLVWAGWLLAGALMCWRPGRRRAAGVAVVSLSTAFAVYGGFPETLLLLALAMAVLVAIAGAIGAAKAGLDGGAVTRLAAGVAAGTAMSAPLWFPGLAVLHQSSRFTENASGGVAFRGLALVLAQGYDGLPTSAHGWFGPADYYEATAYVGIVAVVLALFSVLVAGRRPIVAALAGTSALCVVVVYTGPGQRLLADLGAGDVATQRMLPVLAFCLAVLAGLGLEALRRRWRDGAVQVKLAASAAVGAVALTVLAVRASSGGLSAAEASSRRGALLWPLVAVLGLAIVVALALRGEATGHRAAGALVGTACLCLLAAQSVYLVVAGVGLNSYAARPYPVDSAIATLKHLVGGNLVALDGPNPKDVTRWTGTGLYPEVNIGYGIRELAIHDPVLPPSYLRTWPDAGATVNAGLGNNIFAPAVGSAARARFYGAAFILASPGRSPKGATLVARIPVALVKYVSLYRVPGAAQFSFGPATGAQLLRQAQTANNTWQLAVKVPEQAPLTLRLTYLPGWHVSADGHPLPVHEVDGLFVGVSVPAGTRTIVVHYWPGGLSAGFALALVTLLVLAGALAIDELAPEESHLRHPWHRREAAPARGLAGPTARVHTESWWG